MNVKKAHYLAPLALIVLIAAALACDAGQQATEAPASDDQVATAVAQTPEGIPSATALQAPASERADASVPVKLTDTPSAGQPSPEPEPTSTPMEEPAVVELKGELWFQPGGGWPPGCADVIPQPGEDLPLVKGGSLFRSVGSLCLFGLPSQPLTEIAIDLQAPGGEVFSGIFELREDGQVAQISPPVESRGMGSFEEIDGISVIEIHLWWPVGLPAGEWYAQVSSSGEDVAGTFEPTDRRLVSTVPDTHINPFERRSCDSYRAGEQVIVLGTGFEPSQNLPLGIYYLGESDSWSEIGVLEYSEMVATDEQGDFSTSVFVEPSYPSGFYYVVVITDPDDDTLNMLASNLDCFTVR